MLRQEDICLQAQTQPRPTGAVPARTLHIFLPGSPWNPSYSDSICAWLVLWDLS